MEVYCYMKRKHILLVLAAVLVLSLCGCMPEYVDANDYIVYEADAPRDVTRITAVVTADDIAQLEQYPALVRADLTGSTCYDELLEYRLSHPDVTVIYNVNLLGKEYTLDTVSINLSGMDPAKVHEAAKLLPHFSSLRYVELMKEDGSCALTREQIKVLQDAIPEVPCHFTFALFGKQVSTSDTVIEFVDTPIYDSGLAKIEEAMALMPKLEAVKLDNCGTTSEAMDKLRSKYPDLGIHWRVWFGKYTCMTDETVLRLTNGLKNEHIGEMKYLTMAEYVDIGHNEFLSDISFFEYMPNVKLIIGSGTAIKDVTALQNLKNLEFLELVFCDYLKDISPLAGCTGLKYLNISITRVSDLTPLKDCPLERMVALQMSQLTQSEREEFAAAHDECLRVWYGTQPYGYGWRYSDNGYTFYKYYANLRVIFDYDDKYKYNGRYYTGKRINPASEPAETPVPTETPAPTKAPEATKTPAPTVSPEVSVTPAPTPVPGENETERDDTLNPNETEIDRD